MAVHKTISLKGEILRVDVKRLQEIKGGAVLGKAIQRLVSGTNSWSDHSRKWNKSPSWSDYAAHSKTIKK